MRVLLCLACLAVAAVVALTWAGHRTCEDARRDLFALALRGAGQVDAARAGAGIREHCRGTDGLLAAAGALRGAGDEAQALEFAREAAAAEPENPAVWRAVAAVASGAEAREAERRLARLDPLSLKRSSGRSTR